MNARTILFERHVEAGARMVPFGGWDMPVQYDGVLAEHARTRGDVAMFDICHMDAFQVDGTGSQAFLARLLTPDLAAIPDGCCRYGFMMQEDGGVLDDLIVYRFSRDAWMVVVNAGTAAGDFAWLRGHRRLGEAVELTDLRDHQGKIDVQGPNSPRVVAAVLGVSCEDLRRFTFRRARWQGAELLLSRTGYTGEDGFELYAPLEWIVALWDALAAAGVAPAGLGARDTLRLEAGLPLYGHELSPAVSPVEAGLTRFLSPTLACIGASALSARAADPAQPRLTAFTIDGRQTARNGNAVLDAGGAAAGWVTSGSFAPTLGHAIGFAYVRRDLAQPGARLQIDVGRRLVEARVTTAPFYKRTGKK